MTIDLFPVDVSVPPLLLAIEDCRKQCRVDHEDEDAELVGFAAAAQAWVEKFTGRALTLRESVAHASCWSAWRIVGGPVQAISSISYFDRDGQEQAVPDADYVRQDRLRLTYLRLRSALTPPELAADSEIRIGMTLGYPDGAVPADLRIACLLLVGHWYVNREAVVTGTISSTVQLATEALCGHHRLVTLP